MELEQVQALVAEGLLFTDAADQINIVRANVASRLKARPEEAASVMQHHNGLRGALVGRLNGLGLSADDRHHYLELVVGARGGSSVDLTVAQARALMRYLDDGGHEHVWALVYAARKLAGQAAMPLDGDPVIQAALKLGAEVTETTDEKGDEQVTDSQHWASKEATRIGFFDAMRNQFSYDEEAVLAALGVGDLGHYPGERVEAFQQVKKHAANTALTQAEAGSQKPTAMPPSDAAEAQAVTEAQRQEITEYEVQARQKIDEIRGNWLTEPEHTEALSIAFPWDGIRTPDGDRIKITLREGATYKDGVELALELWLAMRALKEMGWTTEDTRILEVRDERTDRAAQPPPPAPVQADAAPPPPPAPASPPPPPPLGSNGGEQYFDAVKFRMGATRAGKPTVGFFAAGHEYPDASWGLVGEGYATIGARIMADFPELSQHQWKAAHFDAPYNIEYQCRLRVFYTLSGKLTSKGNPYKDISRIEPLA